MTAPIPRFESGATGRRRRRARTRRRGAALVAWAVGAALLAGCASEAPELTCPRVEVLSELGELTRFRENGGRDPTDVAMYNWIERAGGECTLDRNALGVDLTLVISSRRGPADASGVAQIRYFVAVADSQENVLSRQAFSASLPYGSRRTVSFADPIELLIPMREGMRAEGYVVYVGFEMTPEELEYNRRRLRGGTS